MMVTSPVLCAGAALTSRTVSEQWSSLCGHAREALVGHSPESPADYSQSIGH